MKRVKEAKEGREKSPPPLTRIVRAGQGRGGRVGVGVALPER